MLIALLMPTFTCILQKTAVQRFKNLIIYLIEAMRLIASHQVVSHLPQQIIINTLYDSRLCYIIIDMN